MPLNVAAQAGDDDEDLSALLGAELDRQDGIEPEIAPEIDDDSDDTAAAIAARARDEATGRFKKAEEADEDDGDDRFASIESRLRKAMNGKAGAEPIAQVAGVKPAAPAAQAAAPADPTKPAIVDPAAPAVAAGDAPLRPPPGWSPTAKAAFAALPDTDPIKLAVAKREVEVNAGLAKLADYKPIERFSEMARQSGTTLDRALENYVGIEGLLKRDFLGGISHLCQRQGVDPTALANAILTRSGNAPAQGDKPGAAPAANQQAPGADLSPIIQRLDRLDSHFQQQQTTGVKSEIETFGSDPKHPYFENVRADMGRLIKAGLADGLADAYEQACYRNPEIRDLLIKQQTVAAPAPSVKKAAAATQARAASRSITGSPAAGSRQKATELSIEDEVRAAYDASSV